MKSWTKIKKIMVTSAITVGLVGASLLGGCAPEVGMTQAEYDVLIGAAKMEGKIAGHDEAFEEGKASVDITSDNEGVIQEAIQPKLDKIEKQQLIIEDYKQAEEEVAAQEAGYLIDDIAIGGDFDEELSDREVATLFDGKVRFDGDNYDVEEVVTIIGSVDINEEDYNGATYLAFEEEGLSYLVIFEDELKTNKIDEDETLKFEFLGEEVEVSDWDGDEVTFTIGEPITIKELQTITVGDKQLTATAINKEYAYITVDGSSARIEAGETQEVGGVEVSVKEVLDFEVGEVDPDGVQRVDFAIIRVGEDVLFEVEAGDEYDPDERFVWVIDENSIGLTLDVEYNDLDDDERPLAVGERLGLPNDYVKIVYDGLTAEDMEEVTLEEDDDYDVEVRGNFKQGTKDYDRIYINASGIYDEDDDLIHASEIEIDNTELLLENTGTKVKIGNVKIPFALDSVKVAGEDISSFDEGDYITEYGIVIDNPEDSVDDNEFVLEIPEEERTAEATVY